MIKVQADAKEIAKRLKNGEVVALPTETVYGLAVALDSPSGLEKLISLKHREVGSGKVFTLVPASPEKIGSYAMLTGFTEKLIRKYFPGELTLILHKNPAFRHPYFDHFKTIGVRIPRHPLVREVLALSGPLLLTSANPRGEEPALSSQDVERVMPRVEAVVEGAAGGNPPSTVLDCTVNPAVVVRQGKLVFNY